MVIVFGMEGNSKEPLMDSRTKNTKRNLYSGMISQIMGIILPFFVRTVFLYTLGAEYQGLSSLFNSILHVLNLADLGFSSAVIYVLYKPISNNNTKEICSILSLLKKVYFYVGIIIIGLGLILLPFLTELISGSYPEDVNIHILFCIYLLDAGISYLLFGYKNALLTAMQRTDLINNIYTITSSFMKVVQLIFLLLLPNFYIYAFLMPIFTMINSIIVQICSKKYFPNYIPIGEVSLEVKYEIKKQLRGIIIGKIGDTSRNSMDSIFISLFLGLTTVARYDNYYYVFTSLYGVTLMINKAMQASVGNSIARDSVEKNYKDLCRFTFIFEWMCGWMSICMVCLYQPFMKIWMRDNISLLFPNGIMFLFCLYFYVITANNIRNLYINGAGLFWDIRKWNLIEAIANILLNYLLGYYLGVSGIILATIITIILFNFIARSQVLFKRYFRISIGEYFKNHCLYLLITLFNGCITYIVCSVINEDGLYGLFIKALLCLILPNILYYLVYRKTSKFTDMKLLVKQILHS